MATSAARSGLALANVASLLLAATIVGTLERQPTAGADPGNGNCPNTAAAAYGWGDPNRVADFTDPSALADWNVYDSVGHDGNGRRTPSAVSVADGMLTITGDAQGNSGGMAWTPGQFQGRWEACVKSPPASENYHSVVLLWPDANDWPSGGEVDFMELSDPTRQSGQAFVHYGPDDTREDGDIQIDATQWHSWAVEWTGQHIAVYLDGAMWWETTTPAALPPRPMHLCIQLDDFGGDIAAGGQVMVDWVRQYSL